MRITAWAKSQGAPKGYEWDTGLLPPSTKWPSGNADQCHTTRVLWVTLAGSWTPHSHWLTPPQWSGGEKRKNKENSFVEIEKFNRTKMKVKKLTTIIIIVAKQIMHNAVCSSPTDWCPASPRAAGHHRQPITPVNCSAWCHMAGNFPWICWSQLSQLCPLTTFCASPDFGWKVLNKV